MKFKKKQCATYFDKFKNNFSLQHTSLQKGLCSDDGEELWLDPCKAFDNVEKFLNKLECMGGKMYLMVKSYFAEENSYWASGIKA